MTQTSADDLAYLKACAALGIDPTTKEKVGNEGGIKLPKEERKRASSAGESVEGMTRRRERECKEENKQGWLEHCDHMKRQHLQFAREWAQRYDAIADGGSGG